MLLLGGVFASMYGMVAVYATAAGFGVGDTARLVMALSLGAILTQYPIGTLSDRIDRRWLVIALSAVGSIAAGVGAFVGEGFGMLFIVIFVIGGTTTPAYALLIAHVNDAIHTDQMAAASATLLLIAGIGSVIGPVMTGHALSAFGETGFFLLPAALLGTTALYGLSRMRHPAQVRAPDRTVYRALTAGTSAAGVELAYAQEPDRPLHDEAIRPAVRELKALVGAALRRDRSDGQNEGGA